MYPIPGYRSSPVSSGSDPPEHGVLNRVQDKHATVALTVAFLMYSTVSTVIFQVCVCPCVCEISVCYGKPRFAVSVRVGVSSRSRWG